MDWSRRLRSAINWLLIILIGVLPFVFCWVSDELFEFNKMLVVYVFASLTGGLYLLRMIAERRLIWRRTFFDWPLAAFLLSQLISTCLSMHPRTSLLGYYTRLNGGLLSTLAYLTLYAAFVNNMDTISHRRFWRVAFASGLLVSLYAIGEHFGHSVSCLIIKGQFTNACWVQDVQTRVYATFGQPNWLAAYNVTLIGLGIILLYQAWLHPKKSGFFDKYILPISVYLNFLSLIFTKSRSGTIAFFIGLTLSILLLIYYWTKNHTLDQRRQWRCLALTLSGFVVLALIWGTQYTPALSDWWRAARAAAPELTMGLPDHLQGLNVHITDSADIRRIVWRGALAIWRDYPLFGTGVETFAYSYYRYRPSDHNWTSEWDFLYNKAHNELLNLAANSGTFGLLTYLSILLALAYLTFQHLHTPTTEESDLTLIGVSAALAALSITNFFGFSTVTVQVLLFLFLALSVTTTDPSPTPPCPQQFATGWTKLAGGLVVIGVMALLNQVWLTWDADYNYARCKSLVTRSGTSQALPLCARAIQLRPQEALYQIELANYYAGWALALAKAQPDQTAAIAEIAARAIALSNNGLRLNPYNLNFYKTRFQMLRSLANLEPSTLTLARSDLETAMELSPTDPKLTFYYSTLLRELDEPAAADEYLARTLQLRPLYLEARLQAAARATEIGDSATALTHYQYILQFIDATQPTALAAVAAASASSNLAESP